MDRTRRDFLRLAGVGVAGSLSPRATAAPVPREDWWLEMSGPGDLRGYVRVATGERRPVRRPAPELPGPALSPDGKWLADVRRVGKPFDRPEAFELFVRPVTQVDGGNRIARVASLDSVAWTRDSKRIVFLTQRDGWKAYSTARDGSDERQLTMTGGFHEPTSQLRLLPDGRCVHIGGRKEHHSKPTPGCTYFLRVGHLVVADGVRDRFLCRDTVLGDFEPSPDGSRIAYETGIGPVRSELVVHDLKANRSDRVRVSGFRPGWECTCGSFLWRPDSGALAFGFAPMFAPLPDDLAPFTHVGVVTFGSGGPRVEAVAVPPWEKNAKGEKSIGYQLVRWVDGTQVERDGRL